MVLVTLVREAFTRPSLRAYLNIRFLAPVLQFNEVNSYLPVKIQPVPADGQVNINRESKVPESGSLEGSTIVDLQGLGSRNLNDSALEWPADDTTSESSAASFATAQSGTTIRASAIPPDFSRQNTDATIMSYATARGEV